MIGITTPTLLRRNVECKMKALHHQPRLPLQAAAPVTDVANEVGNERVCNMCTCLYRCLTCIYIPYIYICVYIHTYLHIRKGIYVYVQIQEQEHVHRVSSIALLERLFSDYKFGQVEEIPPTQVTPPRSRVDRKRKNNHEVKEIQNVALFFDFMLGGVARVAWHGYNCQALAGLRASPEEGA